MTRVSQHVKPIICPCGKDGFLSRRQAERAGQNLGRKKGRKSEAYWCEDGQLWHFTTRTTKRRRKRGRPHGV